MGYDIYFFRLIPYVLIIFVGLIAFIPTIGLYFEMEDNYDDYGIKGSDKEVKCFEKCGKNNYIFEGSTMFKNSNCICVKEEQFFVVKEYIIEGDV